MLLRVIFWKKWLIRKMGGGGLRSMSAILLLHLVYHMHLRVIFCKKLATLQNELYVYMYGLIFSNVILPICKMAVRGLQGICKGFVKP